MFNPMTWDAPYLVVVAALFVIVMFRANGTYWLGRGMAAGVKRTRLSRLLESKHYATASRWLGRWGAPAVAISFLTVGVQTMINLAAGVTRMPLRRYLPAVIVGSIMWAFIYGSVGFLSLIAIQVMWQRSPVLVIVLAVVAVAGLAWAVLRRDAPAQEPVAAQSQ